MAIKLPQIGVEAIVLNSDRYFSVLENIEKATSKTASALEKTASQTAKVSAAADKTTKSMNPMLKAFDAAAGKLGGFGQQMSKVVHDVTGAKEASAAFFAELPAGAAALTVAAAAAAAFATAFVALGTRGAGLVGLAESFDRLNQAIGVDAVASLNRLRIASGGTVADFELIRLANLALAGSTGEFGRQFGENLPRILEIARVQARATGQDVGFLFQSLITGIKRGSPLLIDNTGLVLKISEANAAMALSLGKSVEALTAEEKQLAILNATLAAGQTAIDAFAGIQETAADKIARMNAGITNILDTLAIGVQPAFGMFLDVINRVIALVGGLVTALNPLISSFLEAGAAIITGPLNGILALLEPVAKLIGFLITLATVILQPVLRAITAFGSAIGSGITRVVQFVGELINSNLGINFDNLALNLGRGAGYVFASFANGIMAVANALIFPAVIQIATFIADFLVGQSPPPRGPLAQIDKGGANVMMAWMEGFAGVGIQPVEEVAANVNNALGSIGAMSLPQVEARLGVLDQALAPFNSQLEIIKANFEAISAPAQAALDAIDRQLAKANEALAAGEEGSAERVRALDAQREMIDKAVAAQQELVDQAQIQQALAKSQQAPERALLAIQQARLKAMETKPTKEAKEAAGAAGQAAAPDAAVAGGGGGGAGFDMGLPSVSDLISGQTAVDQMGADLSQGFAQGMEVGLNTGTQKAFDQNQILLQKQVGRIGEANIGQRIADAFTGIGTSIQGALNDATVVISDWIGGITDPTREGSIPYSFNALISGDWAGLTTSLTAPFSDAAEELSSIDWATTLSGIGLEFTTFFTDLSTQFSTLSTNLADPNYQEGILAALTSLNTQMPEFIQPLGQQFIDWFTQNGADTAEWLASLTDPSNIDSIPGTLRLLPARISSALSELPAQFETSVLTPIQDTITNVGVAVGTFFTGTGEGTLSGMIDGGVAWFTALPQRIYDALSNIGTAFFNTFVMPIIGGINLAIEGIETFINNSLSGLNTLIGSLQGLAEAVGFGEQFAEIQGTLAGGITLPRLSSPSAPAPVPLAREGGIFSAGNLRVHRGEELVANSAKRLSVFPADVTQNLDILARILGSGGSMALPLAAGGGGDTSNSTTYNNQFNMGAQTSSGNSAQQIATFMAMRGGRR